MKNIDVAQRLEFSEMFMLRPYKGQNVWRCTGDEKDVSVLVAMVAMGTAVERVVPRENTRAMY